MLATRTRLLGAAVLCGLLVAGGPSAATADGEVSGMVTVGGESLAMGKITFHRQNGQFVGSEIKDGKYKIDCVPAGILRVTFDGKGVPAQYSSQDTSPLVVQVPEEGKHRFDFELKASNPGNRMQRDERTGWPRAVTHPVRIRGQNDFASGK